MRKLLALLLICGLCSLGCGGDAKDKVKDKEKGKPPVTDKARPPMDKDAGKAGAKDKNGDKPGDKDKDDDKPTLDKGKPSPDKKDKEKGKDKDKDKDGVP